MPSSTSHSLNSLVKGTVVEGSVKSESDIRVDGTIKGNLVCDAKVIIGPTGFINGEIQCQNAVIEGRFDGRLDVAELLNIKESANVNGDVSTGKLVVQPGAVFNVTCMMGSGNKRNRDHSSEREREHNNSNIRTNKKVVEEAKPAGA